MSAWKNVSWLKEVTLWAPCLSVEEVADIPLKVAELLAAGLFGLDCVCLLDT